MTRRFYFYAIFFSGLYTIIAVLQSLIFLEIGGRMYTLESFPGWFLLGSVLYLTSSVILLKYYHYKKYDVVFWTAMVATITMLVFFTIVFVSIMAWVSRARGGDYYLIGVFAALGTVILYAITLIFSHSGKRPWLKAGGVFTLIYYVLIMFSVIWGLNSREVMANGTIEKIQQWAGLAGTLLPVFFVANFLAEVRTLPKEDADATMHKSWDGLMIITGATAIVAAFFIWPELSSEKTGLARWLNRSLDMARHYAEPFDARTYVNSKGESLQYRFRKPLDYNSATKYPLVVCLHGGGGSGTDNFRQVEEAWAAMLLSEDERRKNFPAFLLVPQCPPGFSFGGIPGRPGVDSLIFEAIVELEKEFPIDATRRYVIGGSLGGYGTWYFITTRPEIFAGAIPICGEGDPDVAKNIVDVPVWAFHGAKDRSVPVEGSRSMIDAIRNAGGNPRYTEFPEGGHLIRDQIVHTPGVFEWLFAQRRE
jgi:pimeloyl-ACP methyl ester carboxylesterase